MGAVFHIPKALPPALAALAIAGLACCGGSCVQSFGMTDTALSVDAKGRVWLTDQRFVGIQAGAVYDLQFMEGTPDRPVPMPKLVIRHVREWGAVAPLIDTYSTRLGFSDLAIRGANTFHGASQRSFPLLPLFVLCLLPSLTRLGLWRRRRAAGRTIFCFTCSYNLTGNTSGVCPECGTKVG